MPDAIVQCASPHTSLIDADAAIDAVVLSYPTMFGDAR
jgi:hypothetical protein